MTRTTLTALAVLASLSPALAMGGPSFNCLWAKAPDEVAVCNSPTLRNLDRRLAEIYSAARLSENATFRLGTTQVSWLRARRECRSSHFCLETLYQKRIDQLLEDFE